MWPYKKNLSVFRSGGLAGQGTGPRGQSNGWKNSCSIKLWLILKFEAVLCYAETTFLMGKSLGSMTQKCQQKCGFRKRDLSHFGPINMGPYFGRCMFHFTQWTTILLDDSLTFGDCAHSLYLCYEGSLSHCEKVWYHQSAGSCGVRLNIQGWSKPSRRSHLASRNQNYTDLDEVKHDRCVSCVSLVFSTQTTRSLQRLSIFVSWRTLDTGSHTPECQVHSSYQLCSYAS